MKKAAGYLFCYGLPAVFLLVLAFWSGGQKNPALGLIGFLSFFTVAVMLMAEGYRRSYGKKD